MLCDSVDTPFAFPEILLNTAFDFYRNVHGPQGHTC